METKYDIDNTASEGILKYPKNDCASFILPYTRFVFRPFNNMPLSLFIASRSVNMVIECIDDISDNGF